MLNDPATIQKLREDTRALQSSFDAPLIHLNNAGASLMPKPVEESIINYTRLENSIGSYECQSDHKKQLDQVYRDVGRLINAEDADAEIALQESATVAWCNAFYSIKFQKGDVILTAKQEYGANYVAVLQVAKRVGVEISVIPSEENGVVDTKALAQLLQEDSDSLEKSDGADGSELSSLKRRCKNIRLVAITHIPTNSGLVNPCEEIGDIVARFSNVLYLIDACQSAGQIPLDVKKLQCHLLSATSRKYLRGPRGCGFLFVKKELLSLQQEQDNNGKSNHHHPLRFFGEPPTIDHFAAPWTATNKYELKPNARRYEKWENSPSTRLAFGEAVRYVLDVVPGGLPAIWERIQFLANDLRKKLHGLWLETGKSKIELCDIGNEKNLCGLVTFTLRRCGFDCVSVKEYLRKKAGINVVVSTLNVTRLDMSERQLPTCVRASVHYFNTVEENDKLIQMIKILLSSASSAKTTSSKL